MEGAAPVQAVSATVNLVASLVEASVRQESTGSAAAASVVSSSMRFAFETLLHLGISGAAQLPVIRGALHGSVVESVPRREMASLLRAVSAMVSVASGTALEVAFSAGAHAALRQPAGAIQHGFAAANGALGTGAVAVAALTLYKTNSAFRAEADRAFDSLSAFVTALRPRAPSNPV